MLPTPRTTTQILMVANTASPHLVPWERRFRDEGVPFSTFNSHPTGGLPRQLCSLVPNAVRTRLTTWSARRRGETVRVQAHGAGKAALIATLLVDSHPDVIVHGTEILSLDERSTLTRTLTKFVLRRSRRIVITAEAVRSHLSRIDPALESRIVLVHPGSDWDLYGANADSDLGSEPFRFLSMRRILPLYRTVEIVKAFREVADNRSDRRIELVLLKGDIADDEPYFQEVLAAVEGDSRIRIISEFLRQEDLSAEYANVHFAISVPGTDQLSESIVQALAAGSGVIVTDLDAYDPIKSLTWVLSTDAPANVQGLVEEMNRAISVATSGWSTSLERRERSRVSRATIEAASGDLKDML